MQFPSCSGEMRSCITFVNESGLCRTYKAVAVGSVQLLPQVLDLFAPLLQVGLHVGLPLHGALQLGLQDVLLVPQLAVHLHEALQLLLELRGCAQGYITVKKRQNKKQLSSQTGCFCGLKQAEQLSADWAGMFLSTRGIWSRRLAGGGEERNPQSVNTSAAFM